MNRIIRKYSLALTIIAILYWISPIIWPFYIKYAAFVQPRKGYRVLFLSDQYTLLNFMDRSFFFQFEASKRNEKIAESVLWGPGLDNYNNNLTLRENIVQKYGYSQYFDAIFLFGLIRNNELVELTYLGVMSTIREFECFDYHCLKDIINNNCSVVQMSYMVDMPMYSNFTHNRVLIHSPHSADPQTFYRRRFPSFFRRKPLLVGAISPAYPLRQRWKALIDTGKLVARQRAHPGYWRENPKTYPQKWTSHHDSLLESIQNQINDYAHDLKISDM